MKIFKSRNFHGLQQHQSLVTEVFKFVLFIILIFSVCSAMAVTGTELLAQCNKTIKAIQTKNQPVSAKTSWCLGYIKGYDDAHTYSSVTLGQILGKQQVSNNDGIMYCPPLNITLDQLAVVVITYLKIHSDLLNYDAKILAARALAKAYPCVKHNRF